MLGLNVCNKQPLTVKKDKAPKSGSRKSAPIPNVQEMVKKDPFLVPPEYIRDKPIHAGTEKCLSHLSHEIPVIDLSMLRKGCKKELRKLDMACKKWGYFQLVHHGIPEQILQFMKDDTAHFLKQPINEKQKYAMPMENEQGYGHLRVLSKDKKRDWSDSLLLLTHPTQRRDLLFWPKSPNYKELVDIFSSKIYYEVGVELLDYLSVLLGMNENALLELHKEPQVYFDVNYYPPCNKPDRVLGMGVHSDENTITMVLQDQNDVTALQIKHNGGWVPVTPKPNALICNIGEMIEIWSNGKYKSVEHRVVTNKTKVRSIHEVFVTPALDAFIEPLDHLINAQNPKLYKKIRYGDYVNKYFNRVDDCVKPPVNNNRRVGNYANNNFNSGFGDHVNNNFNRGVGNRGVGDYVNNMGVGIRGVGNSGVGMGIGNSGVGGYVNDMVGDYVNDVGVDNGGVDGYVNDMGVDNEGVDGYVNPYFNKGKEGRSRIERIMLAKKD